METTSRACRWVSLRLPLLAGGELAGTERRRVERHLTTCPSCRASLAHASQSVALLRAVGVSAPRPHADEAPSLWPQLAQQIRESRREVRPAPWAWVAPLGAARPRVRLGLGLAAAAGLALTVGGLARLSFSRTDLAAGSATPPTPAVADGNLALNPTGSVVIRTRSRVAGENSPDLPVAQTDPRPSPLPVSPPTPPAPGVDPFQPPLTLRRDFDLDWGTLSGTGNQNTLRAY